MCRHEGVGRGVAPYIPNLGTDNVIDAHTPWPFEPRG